MDQVFESVELVGAKGAEDEIEDHLSAVSCSLLRRLGFGDILGRLDDWSVVQSHHLVELCLPSLPELVPA